MSLDKEILSTSLMKNLDNLYGSKTTLDISMFSTTEDFVNFSPLKLKMAIFNVNGGRSLNCDYCDVLDLVRTLNQIFDVLRRNKDSKQEPSITRVLNSGKVLKMCFYRGPSNELLARISIHVNEASAMHICNMSRMMAITTLLKNFADNYIQVSSSFVSNSISSRMMTDLNDLKSEIHNIKIATKFDLLTEEIGSLKDSLSNIQVSSENCYSDLNSVSFDDMIDIDSENIVDYNKIIENSASEISTLEISEITEPEIKTELSTFVTDVLQGDIQYLTQLGWLPAAGPDIVGMIEDHFYGYAMNLPSDFQLYYGLNSESRKHINYVFRRNMGRYHWFANHGDTSIKNIFPLTYSPVSEKMPNILNIQIAYEALALSIYYRCYVCRMNEKVTHPFSMIEYCHQRQVTDPLWMPHLMYQDKNIISKRVNNIFKELNKINFFADTNKKLKAEGVKEISEFDFNQGVIEICTLLIGSNDLYDFYEPDTYRLSKNNNLTPFEAGVFAHVEQVLDEDVVEYISMDKVNKKFSEHNHMDYLTDNVINEINKYNATVSKILNAEEKVIQPKTESNMVRYIIDHPLKDHDVFFRDNLTTHFKRVGYNKVIFSDFIHRFTQKKLPEDVIIAAYIWNNDGMNMNYTNFKRAVLECKKTVDEIIKEEMTNPAAFVVATEKEVEEKEDKLKDFYIDIYDEFL